MKEKITISLPRDQLDSLQVEAEKRGISRNELFSVMSEALLQNSPLLSQVSNIDLEIKRKKLDVETEKHRKLKNDNNHFEKFGYYPTKPSNYVTRVIEKQEPQQPRQKEWTGASYNKTQVATFAQDKAEPKLTDSQWDLILPAMTNFDSDRKMYRCDVFGCVHGCQQVSTARQHIIDNHEDLLQENLRLISQ